MPERYTITRSAEELGMELGVEIPEDYQARYNAAPAQLLPVVTSEARTGLSMFYWGTIPGWAGNKTLSNKIIQIHKDEVLGKSGNQRLLIAQRCVVPADGFYVWKQVGKKTKIPHRVTAVDSSLMLFPAIWEEFEDENDQIHHTFKLIVTDPLEMLRELSDTMPVIMDKESAMQWLEAENSLETLQFGLTGSYRGSLKHYPVSPRIERLELDHPDLIKEVDSMNQFGNYSLFD